MVLKKKRKLLAFWSTCYQPQKAQVESTYVYVYKIQLSVFEGPGIMEADGLAPISEDH